MSEAKRPVLSGAMVELWPNLGCLVRLDSGEVVLARIRKRTTRRMFRLVSDDRVRLQARGPQPFIVLGHERISAESGSATDRGDM